MLRVFCILGLMLNAWCFAVPSAEALDRLVAGNKRFQQNKTTSPNQTLSRAQELKESQNPFAVVVTCADSRVAPEILFDQGIGDIFVVRVAGNVIGPLEMESIEFGVKYLGASCVLVMGHAKCGAVNAVIHKQTADIRFTAQLIERSVLKAKSSGSKDLLKTATEMNAQAMCEFVKQSPVLEDELSRNRVIIRAAYYDFATGKVELL